MKRFITILFGVLLVWMQIAPLSASASVPPCCQKVTMDNCAASCSDADCCVAHPSPDSKPAPAVPAQSTVQNQISLLASAVVIWTLPENRTGSFSSVPTSPLPAMSAPLYERNCSLLL
ncbi:MAG: hypothetical protein ACREC8_05605 [Limisphaerales bacterium]